MANLKYGVIVTKIVGKIGGQIFQQGKNGNVIKNYGAPGIKLETWKVPPEPKPPTKPTKRLAAQSWKGLTDDQRSAWNAAASSFPATNKVGDTYTPSGFQLYMSCNINLLLAGQDMLSTPPAASSFPSSADYILTADTTPLIGISQDVVFAANFLLEVSISPCFSTGLRKPLGGTKLIGYYASQVGLVIDLTADWVVFYAALQLGQRLQVNIRFIDINTGLKSAWVMKRCIITAP